MTTVFWVILAAVTVVFGFFCGFVFGYHVSEENAVKTGKMTRKGVNYRVSRDSRSEGVMEGAAVADVIAAMRDGKFDAEIAKIINRNNQRRSS